MITDTLKVFESDADVQQIRDGAMLVLTSAAGAALAAPVRERISFQPHPKTLTMAGEFEYFAAQVCTLGGRAGLHDACGARSMHAMWARPHVAFRHAAPARPPYGRTTGTPCSPAPGPPPLCVRSG